MPSAVPHTSVPGPFAFTPPPLQKEVFWVVEDFETNLSPYTLNGTPTLDASAALFGATGLLITGAGQQRISITPPGSPTIAVHRCYFRVPVGGTPVTAAMNVLFSTTAAANNYFIRVNTTGHLEAVAAAGTVQTWTGTTVVEGTIYRLDVRCDSSRGTLDWQVDGVDQTQATGTAGSNFGAANSTRAGNINTGVTAGTMHIDAWYVSDDPTVYPIGPYTQGTSAQTFLSSLTASVAATAAIVNQTGKTVAASVAATAAATRQTAKTLTTASVTATAALAKRAAKTLTASATATATLAAIRVALLTLTASVTTSATLTKRTAKTLAATATATATSAKLVAKTLAASVTVTASLLRRVGTTLATSATATASLTKRAAKTLTASVTATATQTAIKVFLKTLTASVTATATQTRRVGKTLSATLTATATQTRLTLHALTSTVTATATTARRVAKQLSGTATATATLIVQSLSNLPGGPYIYATTARAARSAINFITASGAPTRTARTDEDTTNPGGTPSRSDGKGEINQ